MMASTGISFGLITASSDYCILTGWLILGCFLVPHTNNQQPTARNKIENPLPRFRFPLSAFRFSPVRFPLSLALLPLGFIGVNPAVILGSLQAGGGRFVDD